MMNCGSMYACHGTAIVAIYATNSRSRPLKRSFANAYAAKEDVSVCRNVTASAIIAVFLKYVSSDTRSQMMR